MAQEEKLFKEAVRYYHNGKTILRKTNVSDGLYADVKPVQEACGVVYLGVLKALNGYFLQFGMEKSKLPKSYDETTKALNRFSVKNGKLKNTFIKAYHGLHLLGYYNGTQDAESVKLWFSYARELIEKTSGLKV